MGAHNPAEQCVNDHRKAVVEHYAEQRGAGDAVNKGHLGIENDSHQHRAHSKWKEIKIIIRIDMGEYHSHGGRDVVGNPEDYKYEDGNQ